MNREACVWLKIVMNYLISGLYYVDITRDHVCLMYALMKGVKINVGAMLKSAIRKAKVHWGRSYAFGGMITWQCRIVGFPKKGWTTWPPNHSWCWCDKETTECNRRDDLIMIRMYGLEMLLHKNEFLASTREQLVEVKRKYSLNEHAMAVLGLSPDFFEPTYNDVPLTRTNCMSCSTLILIQRRRLTSLYLLRTPELMMSWRTNQGSSLTYSVLY